MHKIHIAQFSALATYNQRMNQKLYSTAAKLSDDQLFTDQKAFFGSIFKTLQHILGADLIWLRRFQNLEGMQRIKDKLVALPAVKTLDASLASDLRGLKSLRDEVDELIHLFISELRDQDLDAIFRYKNMAGKDFEGPLWIYLTHFFNHQTHHRGQATTLFSQLGFDVGVTDFPFVLREI